VAFSGILLEEIVFNPDYALEKLLQFESAAKYTVTLTVTCYAKTHKMSYFMVFLRFITKF